METPILMCHSSSANDSIMIIVDRDVANETDTDIIRGEGE